MTSTITPAITPEELIEWIFRALGNRHKAGEYGPFVLSLPNYCVGVLDSLVLGHRSMRDRILMIEGIQEIRFHENHRHLTLTQVEKKAPSVLSNEVPIYLL